MTLTASLIMHFKWFSWLSASKNTRKYHFWSTGSAVCFRWMQLRKHFRWLSFPDWDDQRIWHRNPDSSFICTDITELIPVLLLLCFNSAHEGRIRFSLCNSPPAYFIFLFTILLMYEPLHGSQRAIDFWIRMMIWLCYCICMFLHLLNLNGNSSQPQVQQAAAFFKHEV